MSGAAGRTEIRPTFGTTWRFAFSVYWKFFAVIFLVAAAIQFVGYAIPLGTIEYWAAGASYRAFSVLGADWITPGVITLIWNAVVTVMVLGLQFVLFNLLVAAHVGKRFKATEIVLREAR